MIISDGKGRKWMEEAMAYWKILPVFTMSGCEPVVTITPQL
jgi:hypothetical protein